MPTKYQIFVSSTFSDLKHERQAAVEAILAAGHIPAGMELFAAGDESQLEVIRRWIDDSDVYMLILGGRYGSIDPASGLSYTELEYDYAVEKGLPLFALVLSDSAIDGKKIGLNDEHREINNCEKYGGFRAKVLSRISKLVEDCKDIKIGVLESIRNLEHRYTLQGWIRSSELKDIAPIVKRLSELTEENSKLQKRLAELPSVNLGEGGQLAGMDDEVVVEVEYKSEYRDSYKRKRSIKTSWGKLFALFAPELLAGKTDEYMQSYIAKQLMDEMGHGYYSCNVVEQAFQTIKIHLMALNLIATDYSSTVQGGAALFWNLTPAGKKAMLSLRAIRKS